MSGTPTPSMSRSCSRLTYSIVLATKDSSWAASPDLASTSSASIDSAVCLMPLASTSSPRLASEAFRPRLNSREARSLDCGRGSVPVPDSLIDSHPARAAHLAWVSTDDQACPHHCPASLLLMAALCPWRLSPGVPRHGL